VKLAEHNFKHVGARMQGDSGTDGNEIADQLSRRGSSQPLVGPKPATDISAEVARGVIRG
jgi:hypothetical protein